MNSEILLESVSLRQDLCKEENTNVLERVGDLAMLPNTGFATTEQVAEFYGVSENTIKSLVHRNKEEFFYYGYKMLNKKEITELQNATLLSLFKSRSKNIAIFSRPSILLCGCLLRDSTVARLVRQYLITLEHSLTPSMRSQICQVVDERMTPANRQIATINQHVACISQKMDDLRLEVRENLEESNRQIERCRNEIEESREDVNELKNWVTGLERTMSDWDIFWQQAAYDQSKTQSSKQSTITPTQAVALKQKAHEIGDTRQVWRDFKKRFRISQYTLLPANRWEDAIQWLENYASHGGDSPIKERTKESVSFGKTSKKCQEQEVKEDGISRW